MAILRKALEVNGRVVQKKQDHHKLMLVFADLDQYLNCADDVPALPLAVIKACGFIIFKAIVFSPSH